MINPYMHVVAGGGGGGGALAFAAVGSLVASSANVSSFATASVSPASSELLLVAVANSKATAADTPTLSGLGLTWTQVATVTYDGGLKRITIFSGRGTVTPGAITADFAGVAQTGCFILPVQWSGADASTPIVQSATGSGGGTAVSCTMAALGTGNAVWAVSTNRTVPYGGTVEGGWTENNNASHTSPNHGLRDMYQLNATDATPGITLGASDNWGIIAVEIKQS